MQLADVTQRMLERYEDALVRLASEAEEQRSAARFNRCILEAAQVAGMTEGLPEDLLELTPRQIAQYSAEVRAHVEAAKAPADPN
jgi:hypothetical protein